MIVFSYISIYLLFIFFQIINKKKYQSLSIFILIIFSVFVVLLDYGKIIGTDYETYNLTFNRLLFEKKIPEFYIKDSGWLLKVYFYFIGKIYPDFKLAMVILILFHNSVIYYFFKKFSYNNLFYFSVLTYFCFFYVQNSFNALKQSVAICFFAISLNYIYEKKLLKYILNIIFGGLYHTLLLIFLPIYFVLKKIIKQKMLIFLFFVSCLSIIFLKKNIMLIGNIFKDNIRYYKYFIGVYSRVSFNIINFFEVYFPLCLLLFLDFKSKLRKFSKKNKIFINLYYSYCFIYLLTIIDKLMGYRFVLFLSMGYSVVYPYIFYEFFKFLKFKKGFRIFYSIWLLLFLYLRNIRYI